MLRWEQVHLESHKHPRQPGQVCEQSAAKPLKPVSRTGSLQFGYNKINIFMRVCVCVCVIDNIPIYIIYILVFRCVWSCLVFSSSRCYEHGTFVPRLPSIRLKRSSLEQLHCHTRSIQVPVAQTISTQSIWREGAADVIRKFLVLCPEPC